MYYIYVLYVLYICVICIYYLIAYAISFDQLNDSFMMSFKICKEHREC